MSVAVHNMFARIAERYDLTNDVLSLFMHRFWKRKAVEIAQPTKNEKILDLCCGTGDISYMLHESGATIIGVDFVAPMLKLANKRKKHPQLYPLFINADALSLPFEPHSFDLVTISFGIRNVDDVNSCLKEIWRVLKPNGRLVVLEFGKPRLPIFREFYRFYSKHLMPIIGQVLTGNRAAYEYLPETAKKFPDGAEFLQLMQAASFSHSSAQPLFSGVAYIYQGLKLQAQIEQDLSHRVQVAYV